MPKGRGSNGRRRKGDRRRVPLAGVAGAPPADLRAIVTEAMSDLGPCETCGSLDLATVWDRLELVPVVTVCFWCGERRHDWSGRGILRGV